MAPGIDSEGRGVCLLQTPSLDVREEGSPRFRGESQVPQLPVLGVADQDGVRGFSNLDAVHAVGRV